MSSRNVFKDTVIQLALLALILWIAWSCEKRSQVRRVHEDTAFLEALRQKSSSTDAADYFRQMRDSWRRISTIADPQFLSSSMHVEKAKNGKYVLTVEDNLESLNNDLAGIGRDKSVRYIYALVWACGNQIENVERIDIYLKASSKDKEVHHDSAFIPNESLLIAYKSLLNEKEQTDRFAESSNRNTDDLSIEQVIVRHKMIHFFEDNLVVIRNTASGLQWELKEQR